MTLRSSGTSDNFIDFKSESPFWRTNLIDSTCKEEHPGVLGSDFSLRQRLSLRVYSVKH